jgi:hypothetical protein
MASTQAAYPASHELAQERVMRVIDLIATCPRIADEDAVAAMVAEGIDEVDAELLIRFVPCGLSFALLKLMGISKFPSTYQVQNAAGQWVELPLAAEHYFTTALGIGYVITTQGYTERVNKEVFQAVTQRSAELNAVNQYFYSGGTNEELADAKLGSPTFIGISAEQIVASRKA